MISGSQPQITVVAGLSLSWRTSVSAWLDMRGMSIWYLALRTRSPSLPAFCRIPMPALTHSWYHEFSGAMMALRRGWPFRSPPASAAGCPAIFVA